jgi:predicted extracellular nuclease
VVFSKVPAQFLDWLMCFVFLVYSVGRPSNRVYQELPALIPICDIQGKGLSSPYLGETVYVRGVVYADLDDTAKRGFFMQSDQCDDDPSTSDGIFVYLGERMDVVSSGDFIEVLGVVQEYYGLTEIYSSPTDINLLSTGNPFPTPIELIPPFNYSESHAYFESVEGMYVRLEDAITVGPTDSDDRSWVIRSDAGISRVFQDDPAGTGGIVCIDDGGLAEITPEVKVGDRISNLRGALDYSFGNYCLQLVEVPDVIPGELKGAVAGNSQGITLGSFNLANLFDTIDDLLTDDSILSPTEYQRRLQKRAALIHSVMGEPDILAFQEVENMDVLQSLLERPEIQTEYSAVLEEGPDKRGLDVALIYHPDRVALLDYQVHQGCTGLVDGLGPDGNHDLASPQNAITCDQDGDGILDGNHLFSRPPLVAHLSACVEGCGAGVNTSEERAELWLIVVHLKSKSEDSLTVQYTLARRIEQAQFLAQLVHEMPVNFPESSLILLGDMNDYPSSPPLQIVSQTGLIDLLSWVPKPRQYTYIYQGVSQVLDHILVNLKSPLSPAAIQIFHYNSDYPSNYLNQAGSPIRSSDHDPVMVLLKYLDHKFYLPLVSLP